MNPVVGEIAVAAPEPLPANLCSVQPGGGVCYSLELAWGRLRRAWLARFRPGYVARMAACRHGSTAGAPHPILDPRDLKYCRNLCTADWNPEDDPFAWRDRLPFARWGLAELVLMSLPLVAAIAACLATGWAAIAVLPGALLALVVWFFRDPPRRVPQQPGLLVSPADGRVAEVTRVEHDEWIGGPALRIGIFLSIFNVHINRVPARCRVLKLAYHPGQFLNALDPQSALLNEAMWIGLESLERPGQRLIVRQIAGLLARRIVCGLRPGEVLERGVKFGMIKLGSRTELILPDDPQTRILVQVGQRVQAGSTALAALAPAGNSSAENLA
ncbi:MAG: phosphatidylserine decarboxylase [Pirellulales bacterium]|nr:phosphatidylserine decarboxylase [Pirellulales bacterium]